MPKTSEAKLRYMAKYEKLAEVKDKGVDRRRARRHAIAAGKVRIGDTKEIDHKVPLDAGGSGADSNTRVLDRGTNRGWRKRTPGMYGKE